MEENILPIVAEKLKQFEVPDEIIWDVICSAIAEQYGWTVDEASENMANLLNSLEEEDDA